MGISIMLNREFFLMKAKEDVLIQGSLTFVKKTIIIPKNTYMNYYYSVL
jgi:hypothetical protein